MKLLVTGGAGFIGSAFVRMAIAETDCRVVNFDKLTYAGNLENLDARRGQPAPPLSCAPISAMPPWWMPLLVDEKPDADAGPPIQFRLAGPS